VIKDLFRHKQVCGSGLVKNEAQLVSLFGPVNLQIAQRSLLVLRAQCVFNTKCDP
jgi:hypothetical protein